MISAGQKIGSLLIAVLMISLALPASAFADTRRDTPQDRHMHAAMAAIALAQKEWDAHKTASVAGGSVCACLAEATKIYRAYLARERLLQFIYADSEEGGGGLGPSPDTSVSNGENNLGNAYLEISLALALAAGTTLSAVADALSHTVSPLGRAVAAALAAGSVAALAAAMSAWEKGGQGGSSDSGGGNQGSAGERER